MGIPSSAALTVVKTASKITPVMVNKSLASPQPTSANAIKKPAPSVLVTLSSAAVAMANASAVAADAGPVQSITFDGVRTSSYEENATTGTINQASGKTGQATIELTAGKTYVFDSSFSYSYSGAKPSFKFTLLDHNGKIVKTTPTPTAQLTVPILQTGTYTLKIEPASATSNTTLSSYAMNVHEKKPVLPASSGNANVDALLSGISGASPRNRLMLRAKSPPGLRR